MQLTNHSFEFDNKLITFHTDPPNATHLGECHIDILKTYEKAYFQVQIITSDKIYFDNRFDYCKFLEHRRVNFLVLFVLEYTEKYGNKELFKCPIKAGTYLMYPARPIVKDYSRFVPAFIPKGSRIVVNLSYRVKIAKQIQSLINETLTFNFN